MASVRTYSHLSGYLASTFHAAGLTKLAGSCAHDR